MWDVEAGRIRGFCSAYDHSSREFKWHALVRNQVARFGGKLSGALGREFKWCPLAVVVFPLGGGAGVWRRRFVSLLWFRVVLWDVEARPPQA